MKTMHVHTEFGCLFDDNHLHQVNDSHGHRFLRWLLGRYPEEQRESSSRLAPLGVWDLAMHECTKPEICIFNK